MRRKTIYLRCCILTLRDSALRGEDLGEVTVAGRNNPFSSRLTVMSWSM